MTFSMTIAECPNCGKRFYGYSEEEAVAKYQEHTCLRPNEIPDDELWEQIESIMEATNVDSSYSH